MFSKFNQGWIACAVFILLIAAVTTAQEFLSLDINFKQSFVQTWLIIFGKKIRIPLHELWVSVICTGPRSIFNMNYFIFFLILIGRYANFLPGTGNLWR